MTATQPEPSDDAAPPLISWRMCRGRLQNLEQGINVECAVTVARDGTITLALSDIPLSAESLQFYSAWLREQGPTMRHFQLDVTAENGDRLLTERLILTQGGTRVSPEESVLRLRGEALSLSVEHPATAEWDTADQARFARYHLVGFRGFRPHTETTADGRVTLVGASDVPNYAELAGELVLRTDAVSADDTTWLERADECVRGVLLVASLAAGRKVGWSIREFAIGGRRRTLELRGRRRSGRPYDPLFDRLNFGPALRLATHHYSRDLGERTGLDVAIEWYVMDHAYAEARYLASMTALEHIVAKHDVTFGAVVPKAAFRRARAALMAALDADETVVAIANALQSSTGEHAPPEDPLSAARDALHLLRPKLGGLNRLSLYDSVRRLLALYHVPHDDIVPGVQRLIQVRNDLTHRGLHDPGDANEPLRLALTALRELLRRLFLAMLNYEGTYESHHPALHTATFRRVPQDASAS